SYTIGFSAAPGSTVSLLPATAGTISGTVATVSVGQSVTLVASNASGCSSTTAVTAPTCDCPVVGPPSNATNGVICFGAPTPALSVSVGAGQLVEWYDSPTSTTVLSTGPSFTPTVSGVGSYTYYAGTRDVTSNCRSVIRTPVSLTINALPVASAGAVATTVCQGSSISLTASGGTSYSWSGPNSFTSAQQNPIILGATTANAGTYVVTVSNATGCSSTTSVNISVPASPSLAVVGTPACTASLSSYTIG
ncbi:Ig-like domain-containing protein, partial [Spirosoma gilvum]